MPASRILIALLAALLFSAAAAAQGGPPNPRNVLILVADDLGVDNVAGYGEGPSPPNTPQLDALAATGVRFRNAWANPVCAPSRATLQTGRFSFRTGIGNPFLGSHALDTAETILPEMLDLGTGGAYAHSAFGKWHLGNDAVGGDLAPNVAGYSHFEGVRNNLSDYFQWDKIVDGTPMPVSAYATTENVDDALAWINGRSGPWFCYLAFNAPHSPYHIPPSSLHTVDFSQTDNDRRRYKAMVEAMDTEIGRLLASLPDPGNTTVIFLGDNGTPAPVLHPSIPSWQSKWYLSQGGVRVPFIVAGAGVTAPGSECFALINTVDVFATVADLAGIDLAMAMPPGTVLDSVSLMPYLADPAAPSQRAWTYAESFRPNGFGPFNSRAVGIFDGEYKLILSKSDPRHPKKGLYHLPGDPIEAVNLFDAGLSPQDQDAFRRLKHELKTLLR